MPKRKLNRQEKSPVARLFFFAVHALILLGYIILYPFEQAGSTLKKLWLISNNLNFTNFKKDILGFIVSSIKIRTRTLVTSIWNYRQYLNLARNLKIEAKQKKVIRKMHSLRMYRVRYVTFFLLGFIFSVTFLLAPLAAYFWYIQLPQPDLLKTQTQYGTTKILDRQGRLLYEIYIDKRYEPLTLDQIPDSMVYATIAIEDEAFYTHPGFDLQAILRAFVAIATNEELQGGSTITQQLIKNVLLTSERTISRKLKELALSIMVEREYSKDEILELYLNNIPYGGTAYGIEAAAQKYFGKEASALTLSESSLLAGLTSAPSAYSPLTGNLDLAKYRQRQVLRKMVELNYISSKDAVDAYNEELSFAPQIEYIRAAHFVNVVREELYQAFGHRTVDLGGLTVTTTLDLDLQDKVQAIVTEEVAGAKSLNFTNGAAVVLDSRNGEILAYVGSSNYFKDGDGNFDVLTAYRQPGSSIKPVTYALALEKGYTALSLIDDSPITYQFDGQKYTPKNYDGKYHGKVSFRTALANSYNIPAIKLINAVGVDDMVRLGRDMGLENWVVGDGSYGMSIGLGGKEVRLLDLANLYTTFARQGQYKNETPFLSVKDRYGFEIYQDTREVKQVLKPTTAYIITSVLSDNTARIPAFGTNSKLYIPNKTVSVKTGTTNDIRDNLTLGYTPTYTVGVWVGNNDYSPMNQNLASGLTGAAPIWNRIMLSLLVSKDNEAFAIPEDIVEKKFDKCVTLTEVFDKSSKIPQDLCNNKDLSVEKDDKNKKRGDI